MQGRSRRVRIAVVLALAVFAAFFAWRSNQPRKPACDPGRHEEKDSGGKVVKITNTTCVR